MIEEKIFSIISPKMKMHYVVAPAHVNPPYLVYTTISETKSDVFCGQADTNTVIQLDSYAHSPFEAKKRAETAFSLIYSLGPCNVSCSGTYEDETRIYRYTIEFSIIN